MVQLQDAQKGAEVTSEASERELELEAQIVEARSIILEQPLHALRRSSGHMDGDTESFHSTSVGLGVRMVVVIMEAFIPIVTWLQNINVKSKPDIPSIRGDVTSKKSHLISRCAEER
ncbi:hypothetical protein QJS10_CPB17g00693 [Acorus calamus]|uniref:Uncharacterized protein n=1 Tax=Acorus calamus TaxID=4465 RepID=A0AAV9CWW1_ACOCL|nr:hypothetical protein QJS10_CPB17g00693 [Acorus calamus]